MAYISFQPSDYFNLTLWTGNSTTDRAITGVGFQPDFLWIKSRNEGTDHELQDAVRGSTKYIRSNLTAVEGTETEGVKSFDADGYTLGNANYWNWTAKTFVGWSWKAGTTSGLSGGTITPTAYSFNTTSGFSIIAYTGTGSAATIGHGLGVIPKMIVVKRLNSTSQWSVYHEAIGNTKHLILDTTAAEVTSTNYWNDTSPTSSVFSIGSGTDVNASGGTYIAYVFADVKGYSRMGTYTGNGNADGAFIYTGFRPAYFMCKLASGSGGSWAIYDNKRLGYNGGNSYLEANATDLDDANDQIDIVSNGIKLRTTGGYQNTNGATYVYAAFAEFPIVSSNDAPGVAR